MHYKSITVLSEDIRAKKVSPVEVTEHMFARIRDLDVASKSYVCLTEERGMRQARVAEQQIMNGNWKGALHGVPLAYKDIIFTDYAKTTAGTAIHKNFQSTYSATVVERLEQDGAVSLGKLTTTEQAFSDHHPSVDAPVNPWDTDYYSGCSSSGSGVATARGLTYASLGSDTGGSIRLPSAANGLTSIKPTWGRVSRYGVFALGDSFDHIGPMARSASDAAIVLGSIAGRDENDPTASLAPVPDYSVICRQNIRGLRLGLPVEFATDGVHPEIVKAWQATAAVFKELGALLKPVVFPDWRAAVASWGPLCAAETALAHKETYPSRKDEYGPVLAGFIELGLSQSAVEQAAGHIGRLEFSARVGALFEDIDLLLVPVLIEPVPTKATWLSMAGGDFTSYLRYTIPADMTGGPTITFPAGFDSNGLPIAMQLYGRHMDEGTLCQAAAAFQRLTDWHLKHPD